MSSWIQNRHRQWDLEQDMPEQQNSVGPNFESSKYDQSRERRIKQDQYKLQSDENQTKHQMEYNDSAIFVFWRFWKIEFLGRKNQGLKSQNPIMFRERFSCANIFSMVHDSC